MRRSQVSLLFNFPALRNPDRDLSGMARGALTSSFPSNLMLRIRERQVIDCFMDARLRRAPAPPRRGMGRRREVIALTGTIDVVHTLLQDPRQMGFLRKE